MTKIYTAHQSINHSAVASVVLLAFVFLVATPAYAGTQTTYSSKSTGTYSTGGSWSGNWTSGGGDKSTGSRVETSENRYGSSYPYSYDGNSDFKGVSSKVEKGSAPNDSLPSLESRLKSITEMKARLEALIAQLKNATTTSKGAGATLNTTDKDNRCDKVKNAFGKGVFGNQKSASGSPSLIERICDDKPKHATSTKPSHEATLRVLNPNGGSRVFNYKKQGIMITWMAPRSVKGVDITLEQTGSSSVSIAKGVKAHSQAAMFNRASEKKDQSETNGSSHAKDAFSDILFSRNSNRSATGIHSGGKEYQATGHYRWTTAKVGEGYKIVITATSGTTTLTDASDSTFAVEESGK